MTTEIFYQVLPDPFPPEWAGEWGEDEYGVWIALNYKGVRQGFRWIHPGRFMMGSPETEQARDVDETLHPVAISRGFWLGETTCSQALWQAVTGENPSKFKGEELPVETVSFEEVERFIETLNGAHPGLKFRLPTEAEWEYGCRAGTATPFHMGDNITTAQANYDGNSPYAGGEKGEYRGKTVPVKSFPPNGFGLYQMHGNVWEWCGDAWQKDLGGEGVSDPFVDGGGEDRRVVRGGSWIDNARVLRSASRDHLSPDSRDGLLGFRLARGQAL